MQVAQEFQEIITIVSSLRVARSLVFPQNWSAFEMLPQLFCINGLMGPTFNV